MLRFILHAKAHLLGDASTLREACFELERGRGRSWK